MAIPDWLFYLLMTVLVGVLVVFSIKYWPGRSQDPSPFAQPPAQGVSLSGKRLGMLQAGPGLTTALVEEDGIVFLRAAAGQKPDEGLRSAGVFLTLPENYSEAFAGAPIELSLRVRAGGPNPSPEITIAYYSPGRGNSARTHCTLNVDWQVCTMTTQPPKITGKSDVDYAGIWPDLEGLSRTVDIREITIRPLSQSHVERLE